MWPVELHSVRQSAHGPAFVTAASGIFFTGAYQTNEFISSLHCEGHAAIFTTAIQLTDAGTARLRRGSLVDSCVFDRDDNAYDLSIRRYLDASVRSWR
jgi:hypothetical protein